MKGPYGHTAAVRRPGRAWPLLSGLLGLLLGGMATPDAAQAQDVRVEHTGADTLDVTPGERGSVPFRVVSQGSGSVDLLLALEAPGGWRVVAPTPDLALAAGESSVRVVSFFAPADAPAGVYAISLAADVDDRRMSDRVWVRVRATPDVRAEVEEAPTWVTAGESYAVRFRVMNAGNVPLPVRIRLHSPHDFRVRADTIATRMEPGASAVVTVVVTTPEDLIRALTHGLRLQVIAEGDSTEAVARVEVMPHGRTGREDRGGLPTEVRLRVSNDPRAGPPVRVHAAGPIRPGSATRIEALFQGPTQEYSLFGQPDVYRVELESPRFSLGIGDNFYRLSRLTEPGREGLGLEASARAGALEVGGFVQRDRRSIRPDTQYAAFAGLSLGRPLELRGNWFRRDSPEGRREVLSGETELRIPGWLSARGEYGWRPEAAAGARFVDLGGRRGSLSWTVRHVRADSTYGGPFAGLASDGAHVRLRPWEALFMEASVTDQSVRRSGATLNFEQSHRSARLAAGWGSAFTLEGHYFERISRSDVTESDREATSIRLRLGIPFGPLHLYPSLEAGMGEDRLTKESRPFWRGGLRTQLSTGPASLSTSVEYFTGGTLHRAVSEEGFSGTASATLRIGSSLRLHGSAYGTRYHAPFERSNMVVNGTVEQQLLFGHRVSARVLSRVSTGVFEHRETIALLDYTIPLELPIGRSSASASVMGMVFDAATGEPLPRAILRIGGRRIATDGRGRVTVRGLEPGTYYVEIDRSSLSRGHVPTTQMPLRLDVGPGQRTEFEVGMVASGRLNVEVTLVRAVSASGRGPQPEDEPVPRALLEFRSGEERFRRSTDQRGRVELTASRPGEWTVKVVRADLPAFHRFEEDSVSIGVIPGETTELELVARPVERQIEIVATGELREGRVRQPREQEGAELPEEDRQRPQEYEGGEIFRVPGTMTLWQVAWLVYRDSGLWPRIWVAHRGRVPDPAAVPKEIELWIPPKAPLNQAERRAREARLREVTAPQNQPTIFRVPMDMPLWDVAWRVYRDPDLWPKIWVANRDMVPDPSVAGIGLLLEIPPFGPLTPAERRAEQDYRERGAPRHPGPRPGGGYFP